MQCKKIYCHINFAFILPFDVFGFVSFRLPASFSLVCSAVIQSVVGLTSQRRLATRLSQAELVT